MNDFEHKDGKPRSGVIGTSISTETVQSSETSIRGTTKREPSRWALDMKKLRQMMFDDRKKENEGDQSKGQGQGKG